MIRLLVLLLAVIGDAGATNSTTVSIAKGVDMPWVSFGFGSQIALQHGARALDTAWCYGDADQASTGEAVRASNLSRSQIFVTTKVPCCPTTFYDSQGLCGNESWDASRTAEQIRHDFEVLGVEYVDLMLMHWPCSEFTQTVAVYRQLEALYVAGKARSIGVSNFNATEMDALSKVAAVRPAVNQVGFSIGGYDMQESADGRDAVSLQKAQDLGITYMAYSPLGGVTKIDVLHHPVVVAVAASVKRSTAQVALRWLIQRGIAVVTSSNKSSHIESDLGALTFQLTQDDMDRLSAVHGMLSEIIL